MRIATSLAFAIAIAIASAGGAARAQDAASAADSPSLGLALSALAPAQDGCRLSFVVKNDMATEIDALSLEIAVFDDGGGLDRMLRLNFGLLLEGKTRVRQFDLSGTPCEGIGSVLVNDVAACEGAGLEALDCLRAIEVQSVAGVPFRL